MIHDAEVAAAIEAATGRAGALLPVLHALQDRIGYVPPEAVPRIAQALNLSRAEVQGVLSFYTDFRSTPPVQHKLRVCMAEACLAQGAAALQKQAAERLAIDPSGHSVGGHIESEPVYCLGLCACAPALMLDGRLHGRVTPAQLELLLSELDITL